MTFMQRAQFLQNRTLAFPDPGERRSVEVGEPTLSPFTGDPIRTSVEEVEGGRSDAKARADEKEREQR